MTYSVYVYELVWARVRSKTRAGLLLITVIATSKELHNKQYCMHCYVVLIVTTYYVIVEFHS